MLSAWEFSYTTWPNVIQSVQAIMSIAASDSGGKNTSANKFYTATIQGSVLLNNNNLTVNTSPTSVTLPIGNVTGGCNFIYIKNTGKFPFTVTWTPYLGSANVVKTLQPGGFIFEGDSAIGSGVTSLSLQAVGSASLADVVLFG